MSDRKVEQEMEQEMDRWFGAASRVMQSCTRPKKELSCKAKLSVYWSMFSPSPLLITSG